MNARAIATAALCGALFGGAVAAWLEASPARAGPERVLSTAAHEALTAVGPGFSDSFTVSCGTSATEISTNGQTSYTCQNTSTTAVYVGDSGLSTTTAPQYCTTNCPSAEWGGNVRKEYCIVASGTVGIECRALVTQEP